MSTQILSGRAARRELARREKREAQLVPDYIRRKVAATEAVRDRLMQNGITPEDLRREYDKGYKDGFLSAGEPVTKGCYAAVALALTECFGFGQKEIAMALQHIDEQLIYTMDGQDVADEVLQKAGIEILFTDPLQRVREG